MNPADFDQKLEKILITHIADCDSLLSAARLSGGASQETYRIEIKCKDEVRVALNPWTLNLLKPI